MVTAARNNTNHLLLDKHSKKVYIMIIIITIIIIIIIVNFQFWASTHGSLFFIREIYENFKLSQIEKFLAILKFYIREKYFPGRSMFFLFWLYVSLTCMFLLVKLFKRIQHFNWKHHFFSLKLKLIF